jgi:hypothetical protein
VVCPGQETAVHEPPQHRTGGPAEAGGVGGVGEGFTLLLFGERVGIFVELGACLMKKAPESLSAMMTG